MRKKSAGFIIGISLFVMAMPRTVFAAKAGEPAGAQQAAQLEAAEDGSAMDAPEDAFSDGEGKLDTLVNGLAKRTTEETQKYREELAAAKKAAAEKKAKEEAAKKAAEEKRRAEEAAKKAEEARKAKRQEIVDFALQFEGNPYVYGGTSLTNGADCSGFVMSVFGEFGYELPRVASAQCDSSVKKEVSALEAGDLIFYGDYGIDHVALYIGDGKIIHASTSATGIKISDYDYRQPAFVGTYVD